MQYDQDPPGRLTPLPAKNIDTGLGLNRLAAILQGKPSVFETDQFWPLIELGQELSGRRYGAGLRHRSRACASSPTTPAGWPSWSPTASCPSNEDRGYVLRRIMRRAIQQGRSLGLRAGLPGALRRAGARS